MEVVLETDQSRCRAYPDVATPVGCDESRAFECLYGICLQSVARMDESQMLCPQVGIEYSAAEGGSPQAVVPVDADGEYVVVRQAVGAAVGGISGESKWVSGKVLGVFFIS